MFDYFAICAPVYNLAGGTCSGYFFLLFPDGVLLAILGPICRSLCDDSGQKKSALVLLLLLIGIFLRAWLE